MALTLSFAVFGAVGPSCGSDEAQLAAEHVGVLDREVVVADRPPLAFVEELYPALVVFSGISWQSDPEALGLSGRWGRSCGWSWRCGSGKAAGEQQTNKKWDSYSRSMSGWSVHYHSCTEKETKKTSRFKVHKYFKLDLYTYSSLITGHWDSVYSSMVENWISCWISPKLIIISKIILISNSECPLINFAQERNHGTAWFAPNDITSGKMVVGKPIFPEWKRAGLLSLSVIQYIYDLFSELVSIRGSVILKSPHPSDIWWPVCRCG